MLQDLVTILLGETICYTVASEACNNVAHVSTLTKDSVAYLPRRFTLRDDFVKLLSDMA